jgi:hypothetical protein
VQLYEAVRKRLLAATAVTDLVGAGDNARIFWNRRDQGSALPALVLTGVGGEPDDLDLQDEADTQESRIQGSCLAGSYIAARALAKAFSDALLDEAEVEGFLFWGGEAERPLDRGGDTIGNAFVHEVDQDVVLRHQPSA